MHRLPPLRCVLVMLAGFGAWASLARSGPTGAAWLVAWLLAPLLVIGLLVAALAAWRMHDPGDVVQLPSALGVNLLTVAAWRWLAAGHLAVSWVVASVVLLLMFVALDTRPRSAAVPPSCFLTALGPECRLAQSTLPSDKGTPGKSRGRKATGPCLLRDGDL